VRVVLVSGKWVLARRVCWIATELHAAGGVDRTQLVVTGAPVNPDEDLLPGVQHCLQERPP
jgi:hypothetical protein